MPPTPCDVFCDEMFGICVFVQRGCTAFSRSFESSESIVCAHSADASSFCVEIPSNREAVKPVLGLIFGQISDVCIRDLSHIMMHSPFAGFRLAHKSEDVEQNRWTHR